jgi:DNA helicase-2/ATP-dependent DNA helicase PcrA
METLKKHLDEDQVELASDLSENLLVLAGPGSGKTRIITHRITYLYRNNLVTPPYRILAVTFTNKAAAEMRGRVRKLSKTASSWTDIYTFHKFGEVLLRNYGYLAGLQKDFLIYDEKMQAVALKAAAERLNMKSLDAKGSVGVIENMKSEYGSIPKAAAALGDSNQKKLAELLISYQDLIKERNAVDFSDLLCLPLDLVQKFPVLQRAMQRRYRQVLVDECQDTNHVQLMLLRALFQNSDTKICGVADEDQSIYTWRGARIKNLNDFIDVFDASPRYLRRNYRCHPSILRVADSLILKAPGRLKRDEFIPNRDDDGDCRAHRVDVPDVEAEGLFVADMVYELMERGIIDKWSDVTVLGRTWAHLRSTATALNEANMPNLVINEAEIPDTPEVNVLLSAIRSCASPDDELAQDLVIENLSQAEHPIPSAFDPKDYVEDNLSPVGLLKKLRKGLDLDGLVDPEDLAEWEKRIEAMNSFERYCALVMRAAPDLPSFSRMLTLEGYTDQSKEEETDDAVRLMTIHTSKGTERKVIFIVALDEEIFPRYGTDPQSERWDEERRLLYVSITRAEDHLYLVHSESRPTARGYPRPRNPSPLLLEIDHSLLNCIRYPG